MVVGLLMLLFIGFNRIWHFTYIRLDAMLCGFFRLQRLPVASSFWRYVDSMGLNHGQSLIKITSILRERVWKKLGLNYYRIHIDIDTTVETLYGSQQGGRKGYNTKHRGKKGYRPVLCFIAQTREYLLGNLRMRLSAWKIKARNWLFASRVCQTDDCVPISTTACCAKQNWVRQSPGSYWCLITQINTLICR
jgi:hypothetical protein